MLLKLLSSRLGQRRHAGRAEEHPAVAELAACGGLDELRRRVSAEIASGLGTRRILIFEPADGGATYRAAWSPDETLAIPDLVLPAGRLARWLRVNAVPLRVDGDTALYAYWSESERDFLTQTSAAFCVPFVASGRLVAFACAGGDAGVQIPVAESDMRELEILAGHAAARWDELDRTGRAARAARGLYRSQQLSVSGQLAATVSHEVRNPLAAVRSLVQLVRDADLEPDERRRLLDGVVEEVDRIESTLARHLDLSRPHAPLRVEIDARALAAEVVAFVRPYARRRGVDIEFYGADLPLPIAVDPGELRQVLVNVLLNACHACTGRGHVGVSAERHEAQATAPVARIMVIDNGQGMARFRRGRGPPLRQRPLRCRRP
jgi:signal transduction histidine kinase